MTPALDSAERRPRVLIVDDDRNNRSLLELMLGPEGYDLSTAASGEEALAKVAEDAPDLILLDIMMPAMDGYEVAGRIKGDVATKNIPIVIISALDHRAARMIALDAGAEDFLSKPLDRAELCVRVRNLLRLKAYGEQSEKYSQELEAEVAARTAELVERTRALEQQAALLAEQAALLDLAHDAIVVVDMHDKILLWSRGAEVRYGWSGKEALGRPANELWKTEYHEPLKNIEATLLRQEHWEGEVIHLARNGTRLNVDSRWTLLRDAEGAPMRILGIHSDITDRKRADAKRIR